MNDIAARIQALFMAPFRQVAIEWIVRKSMEAHIDDIIRLNQQQLQAGQDADGNEIRPFYRPLTIKIKRAKGQPTDRVTLKDTGAFYKGMYAKMGANGMEVNSSDEKTDDLIDRYGPTIFGLSELSRAQLAEILKPTIQKNYLDALRR